MPKATTGAGHQHPERRLGRLGQRRNGGARRPGSHGALRHWRYSPSGRLGGHGQAAVELPCWVAMLTGHRMRRALGQVRRVKEEAAISRVVSSVQGLFMQACSKPTSALTVPCSALHALACAGTNMPRASMGTSGAARCLSLLKKAPSQRRHPATRHLQRQAMILLSVW